MIKNLIHSERLHKGNRIFFVDLQTTTNGKLFIKIKESSKSQHGYTVKSHIIFEEDIEEFSELLQKIIEKFYEKRNQDHLASDLKTDQKSSN